MRRWTASEIEVETRIWRRSVRADPQPASEGVFIVSPPVTIAAAEDEAAEGKPSPKVRCEGADGDPLAPDRQPAASGRAPPLRSVSSSARRSCAARPRPAVRGTGRRISPEPVRTCSECIASAWPSSRLRPTVAIFDRPPRTRRARTSTSPSSPPNGSGPRASRSAPAWDDEPAWSPERQVDRVRSDGGLDTAFTGWTGLGDSSSGGRRSRARSSRRWLRDDTVTRLRRLPRSSADRVDGSRRALARAVPRRRSPADPRRRAGVVCDQARAERARASDRSPASEPTAVAPRRRRRLEVWLTDNGLADATLCGVTATGRGRRHLARAPTAPASRAREARSGRRDSDAALTSRLCSRVNHRREEHAMANGSQS